MLLENKVDDNIVVGLCLNYQTPAVNAFVISLWSYLNVSCSIEIHVVDLSLVSQLSSTLDYLKCDILIK